MQILLHIQGPTVSSYLTVPGAPHLAVIVKIKVNTLSQGAPKCLI